MRTQNGNGHYLFYYSGSNVEFVQFVGEDYYAICAKSGYKKSNPLRIL